MLTIFSVPRSFDGDAAYRQVNALLSWSALIPRPNIILIGDEVGVDEVAQQNQMVWVPDVARNEFGTPLVNDVFEIANDVAHTDILAYVNSDIVLTSEFMGAAITLSATIRTPFLAVGQRYDVPIVPPLGSGVGQMVDMWEDTVRRTVLHQGDLHQTAGIDYFLFRPPVWPYIPPFALGRWRWDNWLIWSALDQGVPVVDCTACVWAVHQNHDHNHVQGTVEKERNDELVRDNGGTLKRIHDATHRLNERFILELTS